MDTGLFPARTWRGCKGAVVFQPAAAGAGDAQGDPELRQALAEHLAQYRGVRCGAHQIVVGGRAGAICWGCWPLLLPGPAAGGNARLPAAKQVLENNGVSCCCLPVDREGLSVQALEDSGAAVCYVTPSHQFPTGVTSCRPPPDRAAALDRTGAGQTADHH